MAFSDLFFFNEKVILISVVIREYISCEMDAFLTI